ncbi:hypothetical protein OAO87_04870 [bacterium]|nr:hypothetical protein [bacterium]
MTIDLCRRSVDPSMASAAAAGKRQARGSTQGDNPESQDRAG